MIWQPLFLSLQVIGVASLAILTLGLGLGIFLARTRFPGQLLVSTVLNLPLVLPPSVVGYGLLLILGRGSPIQEVLGIQLLFTWQAAAIASTVVALPLMVESTRVAIATVNPELEDAARTLGASELEVLWLISLPLAYRGVLAGFGLSIARGLGEFGATLMVAGSIPGRTQTLPLAIYDAVQMQNYQRANQMVLMMTVIAFTLLWGVRLLENAQENQ
ncbi:molybdate ABC transporter permease subunit [Laspinema olomoucense]|uniref:Molybdenum transport system permease n=1 Tax=Laspinema olomoucense D3b TaxID=2953688 RepID=A0ABT2N2N6_9CYAN|nr:MULTISPECIES: molybdate ABC transporter permease subunit [unclassified Laspinema]MCT7970567.1 molybdate ABC transporter permease subunit [Laspinema sp. D3d]MCT7976938.1 molybdate ABC transporter permease subunit [Laspinema sp. D3b]MCT7989574.1 molybdate ABC transporter permease subunit [Laspinema sp. D3a]MCT7994017.1 molybdate ABC transporter permease subunit [Laspinema sp. D3c]